MQFAFHYNARELLQHQVLIRRDMYSSSYLTPFATYSREDLKALFAVRDATLNTGIFRPAGHDSVWLFVTEKKTPDRTQYIDYLDGNTLYWQGQTAGHRDQLIVEHALRGLELLVFYRKEKYEHPKAAFRYLGRFGYLSHSGSRPADFILVNIESVLPLVQEDIRAATAEEDGDSQFGEGGAHFTLSRIYERNPQLRAAAIAVHGTRCQVCDFSFEERYGAVGAGFIEVHHLRPISTYSGPTVVDPRTEMAVLCANCHRMMHRDRERPLTMDALRTLVSASGTRR